MKFNVKPKPKVNLKKSLQDKSLVLKDFKTECNVEFDIDDVDFKGEITFDVNYQNNKSIKDRVSSAKFSATKKF